MTQTLHDEDAFKDTRASAFALALSVLFVLSVLSSSSAQVFISEFMAINDNTLTNDLGVASDWIELYNGGSNTVDLSGWHLTDRTNGLAKWTFPSVTLEPDEFLLIYASGLGRTNLAAPLHTNFRLDGDGEYLALVKPDGATIAHHFAPAFPSQYADISYGLSMPRYSRLVGHWAFDDASTTASLLADTSTAGDNKSGTFLSGSTPAGVAGVVGGAVELFGNQGISLGSSPEYDRTTWTASMWLYSDSGVTGWRTAFGSWNAGGQSAVHIGRDNVGTWGDHGGGQTSGGSVQGATWTHVVSVRTGEGQENSLWIDGEKQAQTSSGAPGLPGAANVYLGTKNGADNNWDGRIDDLGYFDDTLTSGEIVAIQDLALASMFDYDLADAQHLFELHRAGNGSLTVKGIVWGYSSGLEGEEGLHSGRFGTWLVLDGNAGTGVELGLSGPPPDTTGGVSTNARAFFTVPTPGTANGSGVPDLGPRISDLTGNLPAVLDSDEIVVTARVEATAHPVGQVSLHYRVMFAGEQTVGMRDDGIAPDATAGDGLFAAVIPASASAPGDMVRWCVTATDAQANPTRAPRFAGMSTSPEYLGTVVADPGVTSALPVLQWFVENPSAANVVAGTRASVFYNGEFYDNVFVRRRGQTSANWPKKSYKFEFNDGYHFRFDPNSPRVDEFNLNTTYTDKAYGRTVMSFEAYRDAGSAACESFVMRVQQNGGFFSVAIFIEQPDRDYLRRNGRDPDGALYKVVQNSIWGIEAYRGSATSGVEKKTRLHEDSSDLQALIDGMALNGADLEHYLYDHVDLPACISYMAASVVIQNIDRTLKNFYLYRDTEGDGEWEFFPWDVDLAFGPDALNTDAIVASADSGSGSSHPFMGTRDNTFRSLWNGLLDAIVETPSTRDMFLRRLRTLMDDFLGSLRFEDRIDALVADLGPDVLLDKAAWGANAHFGSTDYTLQAANDRIKNEYLAPRRTHLFTTHVAGGVGIPAAQNGFPAITFGALEYNPPSGNQDEEYIELVNSNAVAVDISGWTLEGGVEHTFPPGTVIVAGGSLYLSPDSSAFRSRASSPHGGENRFVQGPYEGHLSSFGETLRVKAPDGSVIAETTYVGVPSDAQRYLRISELHHSPARDGAYLTRPYEFVEVVNTHQIETISLTGISIAGGIMFDFPGSVALAPGGRTVVVADRIAFAERYATNGISMAGAYAGALDNGGESVKLDDATGSTIHEVTYGSAGRWPPEACGAGHSLVLRDGTAIPGGRMRDAAAFWRGSTYLHGSPGQPDPAPFRTVVLNELAAHTDTEEPGFESNDWLELFNTASNAVGLQHWYLSDDPLNLANWTVPAGRVLDAGDWMAFDEINDFHNPTNTGFGLDKDGEALYLSFLPGTAEDRVADAVTFGAQENGRTLGRYVDGAGGWRTMLPSRGGANTNPPGDVVIAEIMFNPPGAADALLEYVVLWNPTDRAIALSNAVGNWRVAGEIDFTLSGSATVPAGDPLVLVPFDPADLGLRNDFVSTYGLAGQTVAILGPYAGLLSNGEGTVRLQRPQAPDLPGEPVSWVAVDEVYYTSFAPWFDSAAGTGLALHRWEVTSSGADINSWRTGYPSPLTDSIQWPTANLSIAPVPGGVRVDWEGAAGFRYALQRSASLSPVSWETVGEVVTNGRARVEDVLLDRGAAYRVRQRE